MEGVPPGQVAVDTNGCDPDDERWEPAPGGWSLAATAWFQALPATTRSRLGFAYRAVLLRRALTATAIVHDGLAAAAVRLARRPDGGGDAVDVVETARRRAAVLRDALDRMAGDRPIPGAAGDAWARLLLALASVWPTLALALAALLPDPVVALRRLERKGFSGHPALQASLAVAPVPVTDVVAWTAASLRPPLRALLAAVLPGGLAFFVALAGRVPRGIARHGAVPVDVGDRASRDAAGIELAPARAACARAGLLGALPRAVWRAVGLPDGATTPAAPPPSSEPEATHLLQQPAVGDAELLGGARLDAPGALERGEDLLALEAVRPRLQHARRRRRRARDRHVVREQVV
jgi:hypothetical protein